MIIKTICIVNGYGIHIENYNNIFDARKAGKSLKDSGKYESVLIRAFTDNNTPLTVNGKMVAEYV